MGGKKWNSRKGSQRSLIWGDDSPAETSVKKRRQHAMTREDWAKRQRDQERGPVRRESGLGWPRRRGGVYGWPPQWGDWSLRWSPWLNLWPSLPFFPPSWPLPKSSLWGCGHKGKHLHAHTHTHTHTEVTGSRKEPGRRSRSTLTSPALAGRAKPTADSWATDKEFLKWRNARWELWGLTSKGKNCSVFAVSWESARLRQRDDVCMVCRGSKGPACQREGKSFSSFRSRPGQPDWKRVWPTYRRPQESPPTLPPFLMKWGGCFLFSALGCCPCRSNFKYVSDHNSCESFNSPHYKQRLSVRVKS